MTLTIDSSCTPEAGGQVSRYAIALAAMLKKDLHLLNIRSGRENPGLRQQHCTCIDVVAEMCGANVTGNIVGSSEVTIVNMNHVVAHDYEFNAGNGSVTLISQVVAPITSTCDTDTTIMIKGSTNASNSPPLEFFKHVLLPTLRKYGAKIKLTSVTPAFTHFNGGKNQGQITLQVSPFTISGFDICDRGVVVKVYIYTTCSSTTRAELESALSDLNFDSPTETHITEINKSKGISLTLVAETTTGCLISGSAIWDKNTKSSIPDLVSDAYKKLTKNLETEDCVDEWMQDQLLIWMAMSKESSRIRTTHLSNHTISAIYVIEKMTSAKFTHENGILSCTGNGLFKTDKVVSPFPEHLRRFVRTKTSLCELGTIETYMVHPLTKSGKIMKRGIDDFTYQLYPELLEFVPRAYSVLHLPNTDIVLKGFPKFTGETPYDDDDITEEYADMITASEPIDEIATVEFQEKANGKMGIATFFKYNEVIYIFGGSKNVHVVRRMDRDIEGDQLHEKILACIQKDIREAGINDSELLGQTLVGEYEDGCHIIYREEPRMVYFGGESRLPTVKDIFPPQKTLPTQDQIRSIRNLEETEGAVIVYRGKNGNVVCRKKIKTISYVLLRAAREKLCNASKDNYREKFDSILKTFKARGNKTFLDLDEDTIMMWYKKIINFAEFVAVSKFTFQDLSFHSSIGMARVWHAFLTNPEKHMAPMVEHKLEQPSSLSDLLDEENLRKLNFAKKAPCPVLIITRGPSGSGKSTLAKMISAQTFCTDDEFIIDGQYVFDSTKLKQNHNTTFSKFCEFVKQVVPGSKGIIATIANTALVRWEFERYSRQISSIGGIAIVLNLKVPDDVDVLYRRSTHLNNRTRLSEQYERFKKSVYPMYYGIFFAKEDIPEHKWNTVPHVTLLFCGGSEKTEEKDLIARCGEEINVSIIGFSSNKAGTCLVTDRGHHVTTSVTKGYKPVDVGTSVNVENTMLFEKSKELRGIVGMTY